LHPDSKLDAMSWTPLPTAARRIPRTVRAAGAALAAAATLAILTGLAAAAAGAAPRPAAGDAPTAGHRPNVLLITVDTLRPDRLSGYGYERPTSPRIDRLMARGARFTDARTVEPLTNPALSSMITGLFPHEHGATRNGLRMRPGLASLPKALDRLGYSTAAFVANWTLKDPISGLGEHFGVYSEVLTHKRWFGLFKSEADAEDVNQAAIEWLEDHAGRRRPFLTWVHYVEPHAPYVFHEELAEGLGIDPRGGAGKSDRYDTEIAFVDRAVGELLDWLDERPAIAADTLVVFAADHGESLGEHGYWGHGRNLFEPNLRIPLAVVWPGRVPAATVAAPAVLIDVPATVLGLIGVPAPAAMHGFDWSTVLTAGGAGPADRLTLYQAHKGAVLKAQGARDARREGLLEVGVLRGSRKEVLRVQNGVAHYLFDIARDPAEERDLEGAGDPPSEELATWLETVETGLTSAPDLPAVDIDPESVEKLRSLGYTG
jgi:arylsulfatase A-like enzyme